MIDVIDHFEAKKALLGEKVSLSLGYTRELYEPYVEGDVVRIKDYEIPIDILRKISEKRFVYELPTLRRIEKFDRYYYRLYPVRPREAPTLEISGIFMHRIKGSTPREDARSKVYLLRIKHGHRVLDTCMGLGYTAIHAKRLGGIVTTVEISQAVIEIASKNPWSSELKDLEVINADIYEYISEFDDHEFDRIIHDPPRISLAGELYSLDFYRELYRVLKPGGRLYHYVGDPGGKYRRKKLRAGVARRLREAGFYNIRRNEKTKGLIALRP